MSHKIIDITRNVQYEKYLYSCFVLPFVRFKRRHEYLKNAIPKGFCKKILVWNNKVVGQIEYAPAEVSGLPIKGKGIFVMNCIWVLRKAKKHNFGKILLEDVLQAIKKRHAKGLAAIALENHPSPWLRKVPIEKLGFKVINSVRFEFKVKHTGHKFKVYLMWLPIKKNALKPIWKPINLTEGVKFCLAHPLYHPESIKQEDMFEILKR